MGKPLLSLHLREPLRWSWKGQLVSWPLPDGVQPEAVLDEEGQLVPFQVAENFRRYWSDPEAGRRIHLSFDLEPDEEKTWTVATEGQSPETGLTMTRGEGVIEIDTGTVAVRIPDSQGKSAELIPGPILGLKGPDGQWRYTSRVEAAAPLLKLRATVEDAGPLFARVRLVYSFAEGGEYQVSLSLIAGEDVVLVEEEFNCPEGTRLVMDLAERFSPTRAFWRPHHTDRARGDEELRSVTHTAANVWYDLDFQEEQRNTLWPYFYWGHHGATYWNCFAGEGEDFFGAFARYPSRWQDPKANFLEIVSGPPRQLELGGSLARGRRCWGLHLSPKSDSQAPSDRRWEASRSNHYAVKYGQTCLDEVREMVLEWPLPEGVSHPCFMATPESLPARREKVRRWEDLQKILAAGAEQEEMYDACGLYFATGKEKFAREGREWLLRRVGKMRRWYLETGFTVEPHPMPSQHEHKMLALDYDVIAEAPVWSEEELAWLQRCFAFFMLKAWGPGMWPRGLGYELGNPNFDTMRLASVVFLAAVCPKHPQSEEILEYAANWMDQDLEASVFAGGVWLEAPNYQGAVMGIMTQIAAALKATGYRDFFADPRFQATMSYLDRFRTPEDARHGFRMLPTVGDTHAGWGCQSLSTVFGWFAWHCRDTEPAFSRQMMRAWKESGAFPVGFHEAGTNRIFAFPVAWIDPELPSDPVGAWGDSEYFPDLGAILRTADRSYLFLKMGRLDDHYDIDHGCFHWYWKGTPLCLDFGCGYLPSNDIMRFHNTVAFDQKNVTWNERMRIERQWMLPGAIDYVAGSGSWDTLIPCHLSPAELAVLSLPNEKYLKAKPVELERPIQWRRQVMLVHGEDYLVVRDTVSSPVSSEWNLFCLAEERKIEGQCVTFTGQFDTDLDLYLAGGPPCTWGEDEFSHPPDRPRFQGYIQAMEGQTYDESPLMETVNWFAPDAHLYWGEEHQLGVHAQRRADEGYFVLLVPRRRGTPAPPVAEIAEGQGFRITWPDHTDYVFLFDQVRTVETEEVSFRGQGGVISLYADGSVRFRLSDGQYAQAGGVTINQCAPAMDLWVTPRRLHGRLISEGERIWLLFEGASRFRKISVDGQARRVSHPRPGYGSGENLVFRTGPGEHVVELTE